MLPLATPGVPVMSSRGRVSQFSSQSPTRKKTPAKKKDAKSSESMR